MRLKTGDQMEDVDLIILLLMGDQANATQRQMGKAGDPAAPNKDGAETLMITANVLNALTSGHIQGFGQHWTLNYQNQMYMHLQNSLTNWIVTYEM